MMRTKLENAATMIEELTWAGQTAFALGYIMVWVTIYNLF